MKKLNPVLVFYVMAFMAGLARRVAFTTSIIYRVEAVGLDPLQLVLVGTTLELTVFIFEIPTGVVADVYSRRLSTIIGFFLIGLGFILEGLAPLFSLVLLSQVIWGLGWTFTSGANLAWITDEVGADNTGPIFLRGDQLALLGSLAALPISVWLAQRALGLPFIVGGILLLLLGIFLVLFMPETGFKRKAAEEREGWHELWQTAQAGFNHVREKAILMTFVLIAIVVGLYSEGWDRLGRALLLEGFDFPTVFGLELDAPAWFGIIGFVSILLGLGANEIAKRAMEKDLAFDLPRLLQGLYAGMVIAMLTFALTRNFFIAIAAMLIFDGLRNVTGPITDVWLNRNIGSEMRATVLSMVGQLDALGQTLGGPGIGLIGRLRSLRTALLASVLILLPSVPLWQRVIKQAEQIEE